MNLRERAVKIIKRLGARVTHARHAAMLADLREVAKRAAEKASAKQALAHGQAFDEEIVDAVLADMDPKEELQTRGKPMTFREKLEAFLNAESAEIGSNTPDFILANYLFACLVAFDTATTARDKWYGAPLPPERSYFYRDCTPKKEKP